MKTSEKKSSKSMTYAQSGVNYDSMDFLKRLAQTEAKKTNKNLKDSGFEEVAKSRGESAYVLDQGNSYVAFVQEGLGTKNLVADAMLPLTGKTYYDQLAQDTVAMIVNDLITVGAKPTTIMAYWAAGSSKWFDNKERMEDLVKGWAKACNLSGAVWGGGETPTLAGVIEDHAIDLGGTSFGIIKPKKRLSLGDNLKAGDAIILLESSGIHANGLSLARKIAEKLPKKFATKLPSGRMYGEALLDPTIIYAKMIDTLFKEKIAIHYMANITGHGWRKIMRFNSPFTYRLTSIPPVPEILSFMMEHGPIAIDEAYGNLNMGAGFALFVPQKDVTKVIAIAKKEKIKGYHAGIVEHGKKQVIIDPLNITYAEDTLQVRA